MARLLVPRKKMSRSEKAARASARAAYKAMQEKEAREAEQAERDKLDKEQPVFNFVTGKQYKNMNAQILREFARDHNFTELKFAGFAQIKSLDMTVLKKATGVQVYANKIGRNWTKVTLFNIEQCKKLDAHELELRKTLEHEKAVKKGDADAVRAQIAKEVDIERQKLLAQSNDQLTYDLRRENDALKAEIESLKRELEELSKKILKENVEALIQKASDDGDIPF